MMILDTNVLSELMRQTPDPTVVAWLDERPGSDFFLSSVTRAEIELGIALLPEGRRKQTLLRIRRARGRQPHALLRPRLQPRP